MNIECDNEYKIVHIYGKSCLNTGNIDIESTFSVKNTVLRLKSKIKIYATKKLTHSIFKTSEFSTFLILIY